MDLRTAASVFDASVGPCYRCLYPEPPPPGAVPSCAEGGVLGILPGTVRWLPTSVKRPSTVNLTIPGLKPAV